MLSRGGGCGTASWRRSLGARGGEGGFGAAGGVGRAGILQGRIWRGSGRQNSGSEGRAVETSSLPNAKYAAVSILARIRLREEEIVSLFSTLFPY